MDSQTRPFAARPAAGALVALIALLFWTACGSDGPTGPSTPDPQITTTSLPDGIVGEAYSEGVSATGGDGEYDWTVINGVLPPGLALSVEDLPDGDDLLITGTPNRVGLFRFDLRLADADGRADTATLIIEIEALPGPLAIETLRLAPALAGYPYTVQLEAAGGQGGEKTWSLVEGSLPPGLSFSPTGQFSGTPTEPGSAQITLRVTGGGETVEKTFTLVVHREQPDRFNITPVPVVEVDPALQDNVDEALRRWEAALVGNLGRVDLPEGSFSDGSCGGFGGIADGTSIDDVVMLINIDSIDGPGGDDGNVLAQAGPCYIRTGSPGTPGDKLPMLGVLTLDEWDLKQMESASEETVTDIIQHEMGHILGLGTLWQECDPERPQDCLFDLLTGEDGDNPRYTGPEAVGEYQEAGGDSASIPVENDGGSGTAGSHWEEGDPQEREGFGAELMTGFIEQVGTDNFLSTMTIAAFADLGYQVDLSVADPDALNPRTPRILAQGQRHLGIDIVGVGPIIGITSDGRQVFEIAPPNLR